jgi:ABC-2 type transport system permease protein
MKGFFPLYKKELFTMFVTPWAWVVIVVFLFLQGWHFTILVSDLSSQMQPSIDSGPVQTFFGESTLLFLTLLILCPALTMRTFAEERRSGTIESLLTAPISTPALVIAKWLAVVTTYVVMWIPTVLYMVIIRKTGELDWKVVACGYLGVFCIGCSYLAIGVLMSSLTKSQFMALVMSTLILVGLFMFGIGVFLFSGGLLYDLSAHVSVWTQMSEFSKGIVDLRRLVFDATLTIVPLFVTIRVVDSWRWG